MMVVAITLLLLTVYVFVAGSWFIISILLDREEQTGKRIARVLMQLAGVSVLLTGLFVASRAPGTLKGEQLSYYVRSLVLDKAELGPPPSESKMVLSVFFGLGLAAGGFAIFKASGGEVGSWMRLGRKMGVVNKATGRDVPLGWTKPKK